MFTKSLEEIEQIKRLKARYFRLMDTKRWKEWSEIFAEDATVQVATSQGEIFWQGREQIVANNSASLNDAITVHQGYMPEIEITSEVTATGIWAMHDYLIFSKATLNGYGHYHEEYVKEGKQWKIKSLSLTRLQEEFRPNDDTSSN